MGRPNGKLTPPHADAIVALGGETAAPYPQVFVSRVIPPPESLEANRLQTALTRRFLLPVLPELETLFLAMRAETDEEMAANAFARRDKAYPYGYCLEITRDVVTNLRARNARAHGSAARALSAFLKHGGVGTMVWGVLRDRYFQNAIQLGSLYVDVANDSVDPLKPKVEILPMVESGLELVRDIPHFALIAERYWGVRSYANTALPALAPLFPVIIVDPEQRVLLQSRTGYMMRLLASDGFQKSERWLSAAPEPPLAVVQGIRNNCPADILDANPAVTREASLEACRALRGRAASLDGAWIDRMGEMFERVPQIRVINLPTKSVAVHDMTRTNARSVVGVAAVRSSKIKALGFEGVSV